METKAKLVRLLFNMMKYKPITPFPIVFCVLTALFFLVSGCRNKIEVDSEPVVSSIKQSKPSVLNVFIENSGSMDGYMCNGSQLKDAIYDYVSDLNRYTDATKLYYLNSDIIPYKGNISAYVKDLTPTSFHKAGGNTSNTDMGNLIANVLKTVGDSTVSIFVSDCILDLPSKDAQKFLTNCEIRIKEEVIDARKRVPDLGVEILKLSSSFDGKYFYPNGAVTKLKDVKRPYYIWIFGNKNLLAKLNTDVSLSMLSKYDLEGIVAFSNHSNVPFEILNNGMTGKVITPVHGDYHVKIRADFRCSLQPDGVVMNKANYSFNDLKLVINGVFPITSKNSAYTHYIDFTIPKGTQIAQDCLTFSVANLPSWVAESNDDTGADIEKNLSKTTGIKYLIQGVADAYNNEKDLIKLTFNVKRK